MKNRALAVRPHRAAFTLVELLTVIAIIAILAAMILAALAGAKKAAMKVVAKNDEAMIVGAIESYDQDYSRFPVTPGEQLYAQTNDFTTGLLGISSPSAAPTTYDSNSNLVAILMDMQTFPNGDQTINNGHVKNPKQINYLSKAKLSGYKPTTTTGIAGDPLALPGVDATGIFRDPWGMPYIISMDLNYDDHCSDLVYSKAAVSQNPPSPAPYAHTGFYGLSNPDPTATDNFLFAGKVMVWSAGPDRKYDTTKVANTDVNKDNILSWQ